jgi:hypothetical protein
LWPIALDDMTAQEKIKTFLKETWDISIGYRELTFLKPDNFDNGQIGYSVDPDNKSLATGKPGDWKKEWLVIGSDDLGDPFIVDTATEELKVLTAMHGEGEWDPIIISASLDSFGQILKELKMLSVNRTTPVDLERKPITEKERGQFIKNIKRNNSDIEFEYWDNLISEE